MSFDVDPRPLPDSPAATGTAGQPSGTTGDTPHPGAPLVVYGEACRLGEARLALARVTFKHIPYDVKAR